jgi:phospholipid/cholesterol/gamma-HCH transport system ATP-binding protein
MSSTLLEIGNVQKTENLHNENIVISIRGLTKSFRGKPVLQGIDLDLYNEENLVVLGRSGAGKSVLIKIISGLLMPDAGSVMVLGKNISTLSKKEWNELRLRIGFSFQNNALYDSMTVRENLNFPMRHQLKNLTAKEKSFRVEETLEAVGMRSFIDHLPAELSGGQQKRVGIARTLILHPMIMLYDEPTAGLDPITAHEMITLINEIQKRYQTSSIIITHDLTCAKAVGNRLLVLVDGKIAGEGNFDEIFNSDNKQIKSFYDYNFVH